MRRRPWQWLVLGTVGAVIIGLAVTACSSRNPNALWQIVDQKCVPHQRQSGDPSPCAQVDLERGFAVLKDLVGVAQYLLIPTRRVSGIESPSLLSPEAPNDWAPAWDARTYVERALGKTLPRSAVSLAINSAWGRTQDQLHIHIDCVRTDVAATLAARRADLSPAWQPFPEPLAGHRYRAMRVNGADLTGVNPFHLLAASLAEPTREMGKHTLVVVGMTFEADQPGFVVLDGVVDLAIFDRASGEVLQDHQCMIAR